MGNQLVDEFRWDLIASLLPNSTRSHHAYNLMTSLMVAERWVTSWWNVENISEVRIIGLLSVTLLVVIVDFVVWDLHKGGREEIGLPSTARALG